MNLSFSIAKRYFGHYLSFKKRKKSVNAIQLLTAISIGSALIISLASVLILSVFNGLTFLLGDLNAVFHPDLKIEPSRGKVFSFSEDQLMKIRGLENVKNVSEVLEEIALFDYEGRQVMGVVKGVGKNYQHMSDIEKSIVRGRFVLRDTTRNYCVAGLGIVNQLGINSQNPIAYMSVFVPQRKQTVQFGPSSLLKSFSIKPRGEFAIQKEFDDKYVYVPIELIRSVLHYTNEASSLEIKLLNETKRRKTVQQIKSILGEQVIIKDRQQQNESWYKVMRFEKWMSFAILVLIMFIASFNLLSSLTMMLLDKKTDISILASMGMTRNQIAAIFSWQGLLIGIVGSTLGVFIASGIVVLQDQFGIIPLNGSFVVDSYPIKLNLMDVLFTMIAVILISWLSSLYPAMKARKMFKV